jgi:predicted S18 family serine protease
VTATASCAAGKILLGGGGSATSVNGYATLKSSHPVTGGWSASGTVEGQNGTTSVTVTAFVLCGN